MLSQLPKEAQQESGHSVATGMLGDVLADVAKHQLVKLCEEMLQAGQLVLANAGGTSVKSPYAEAAASPSMGRPVSSSMPG